MLKATHIHHRLHFKQASGTSRGILTYKDSWFLKIWDINTPNVYGIGECSIINGLSYDDTTLLSKKIQDVCKNINTIQINDLIDFPALRFAIETAFIDLKNGGNKILFPGDFTQGTANININGLLWMGSYDFMQQQLHDKITQGFTCIKMKVGAIDWNEELQLLTNIRRKYPNIELRVDANGAFSPSDAMKKLHAFSQLNIHSIEQPIKAGNHKAMQKLCENTPLPIALDEELIGIHTTEEKTTLLEHINPQYIIIKPSLLGGFSASEEWIRLATERNIGWWITSALESNIGLNAIAQWTAQLKTIMPQGLGTGSLFTNNIDAPLEIRNASLFYNPQRKWACL